MKLPEAGWVTEWRHDADVGLIWLMRSKQSGGGEAIAVPYEDAIRMAGELLDLERRLNLVEPRG